MHNPSALLFPSNHWIAQYVVQPLKFPLASSVKAGWMWHLCTFAFNEEARGPTQNGTVSGNQTDREQTKFQRNKTNQSNTGVKQMENGYAMTHGGKIIWLEVHSESDLDNQGNPSVINKGKEMKQRKKVK